MVKFIDILKAYLKSRMTYVLLLSTVLLGIYDEEYSFLYTGIHFLVGSLLTLGGVYWSLNKEKAKEE